MGAFFLSKHNEPGLGNPDSMTQAQELFKRQGFGKPEVIEKPNYTLLLFDKQVAGVGHLFTAGNGDFCACTGTLLYRGETGEQALQLLYEDFTPTQDFNNSLYGTYCLIINKAGNTFLFVDRLGTYHAYLSEDRCVWSSSFLATLASLPESTINRQAVYEYVFQGATYGYETLVHEIGLVSPDHIHQLGSVTRLIDRPGGLHGPFSQETFDIHLDRNLNNLRAYYRSICACYGDRIDTALSGGYDSRLTLALLQEQGVTPDIHVYGKPTDADVRVALQIGKLEHIDIKHIDKSLHPHIKPDDFGGIVESAYYAFDGWSPDGIFGNGSDLASRWDRCAGGQLMLNGGGGEIFRNFFYMNDRAYTVRQLLWSFYSQFDPRVSTTGFSESAYHRRLGRKIKRVLGIQRDLLHRFEMEILYPVFRCRFWMGRNNSINNRFGHALTPFIDHNIVRDAVRIPLSYKNFGKFEGSMIRAVSPALAACQSVYGHDFMTDPPVGKKLGELATYIRPPIVRRYTFRIRNRYRKASYPYYLNSDYINEILPNGFVYMNNFFTMPGIHNPTQFNRACTLEYLFQTCSPGLSPG